MEKKLFAIECGNVALVVRPNGDTIIVTETAELVLDNAVMEQIVRNSGAYKSFVTNNDKFINEFSLDNNRLKKEIEVLNHEIKEIKSGNDDIINALEHDNTQLQNNIVGLREELEQTKAAKDKLQQEITDVADGAQPIVKGCIVEVKACRLYDVNGDFLADCGTSSRAIRVQKLLKEGKISLDMVMMVFGNEGGKKKKAYDKVTNEDFNWD